MDLQLIGMRPRFLVLVFLSLAVFTDILTALCCVVLQAIDREKKGKGGKKKGGKKKVRRTS